MVNHPTPQNSEDMIRDTLGVIARTCQDIERSAMSFDFAGLEVHYNFLKTTMTRLETIRKYTQRNMGR